MLTYRRCERSVRTCLQGRSSVLHLRRTSFVLHLRRIQRSAARFFELGGVTLLKRRELLHELCRLGQLDLCGPIAAAVSTAGAWRIAALYCVIALPPFLEEVLKQSNITMSIRWDQSHLEATSASPSNHERPIDAALREDVRIRLRHE
jgi:hypothetical protein